MKTPNLNPVAWIFICCGAAFFGFVIGAASFATMPTKQQPPQIPGIEELDAKTLAVADEDCFRAAQQRYVASPALREKARSVRTMAYSDSGSIDEQTIDVVNQLATKKNLNKAAWAMAVQWCGTRTPAYDKVIRCNMTGAVFQIAGLRTDKDCTVMIVFLTNEQWGESLPDASRSTP